MHDWTPYAHEIPHGARWVKDQPGAPSPPYRSQGFEDPTGVGTAMLIFGWPIIIPVLVVGTIAVLIGRGVRWVWRKAVNA